jgi:uncharacterized membrane protein YkoI
MVKDAAQASEIVKNFLSQMGYSALLAPVRAEKKENVWFVEFIVAFKRMQFEINATTGEILRYVTSE